MEVDDLNKKSVRLSLSAGELILLNNALNEVVNGIDIEGFDTRLGTSRDEARKLLAQFSMLLDKIEEDRHG